MTHEDLEADGPVLLIPNHVTAWDPLLVAMSLRKKQVYYVASEHIFRRGFVSRLLMWLFAPIARPKGSSGLETVRNCFEHLKKGHSICLFAEGEQSWDGRTSPVFPATGKLAKLSGATLVTYRLEGGYLSLPRWGKGIRKGKVHGRPVNIYPPDMLKSMSPQEINAAIERDISEDAYERQEQEHTPFRGKTPAERLETALYLCPSCRKFGTLNTEKDRVFCSCGLNLRYNEYGLFEPYSMEKDGCGSPEQNSPFQRFTEWDAWQKEELAVQYEKAPEENKEPLFSDEDLQLSRITGSHEQAVLAKGALLQYKNRLVLGEHIFPMADISSMAMVRANLLLFSIKIDYYEIFSGNGANLRKYLDLYHHLH